MSNPLSRMSVTGQKAAMWWTTALVAVHLVTLNAWGLSVANGSKALLILTVMLGGLYTLCLNRNITTRPPVWSWALALGFCLPFLLASWPHGFNRLNQQGFEKHLVIFLLPLFLIWFGRHRINTRHLKLLLILSAALAGLYAIQDALTYSTDDLAFHGSLRLGGPYQQHSAYAGLTLLFAFYCLLILLQGIERPAIRLLAVLGLAGSLYACLMSGTRGVLLFIPMGLGLVLWYRQRDSYFASPVGRGLEVQNSTQGHLKSIRAVMVGLVLLALLGLASLPTLQARWEMTRAELHTLDFNDPDFNASSLGARLNLLAIARDDFLEHPWLGVGPGQFGLSVEEAQAQNPALSRFGDLKLFHAHNQFAHDLAERGLPGLLSLLALFAVLTFQFGKRFKQAISSDERLFAMIGLQTVIAFVVFCMSNNFTSSSRTGFFLILITALCWAQSSRKDPYEV